MFLWHTGSVNPLLLWKGFLLITFTTTWNYTQTIHWFYSVRIVNFAPQTVGADLWLISLSVQWTLFNGQKWHCCQGYAEVNHMVGADLQAIWSVYNCLTWAFSDCYCYWFFFSILIFRTIIKCMQVYIYMYSRWVERIIVARWSRAEQ